MRTRIDPIAGAVLSADSSRKAVPFVYEILWPKGNKVASSISVSAPYSLVLVSGGTGGLPDQFNGQAVFATSTIIALGTLCEIDGRTRITLAKGDAATGELRKVYAGSLHGLEGKLVVETCEGEVLLSCEAEGPVVAIEVFSNHSSEPDEILIVYS